MNYITVKQFFEENKKDLHLKILTGKENLESKKIVVSDINRPGLALAGFFDYFPYERIQVFGKTEFAYLKKQKKEQILNVLKKFFSSKICCVIVARNLKVDPYFIELADKYEVPVLQTSLFTMKLINSAMTYLEKKLAPKITLHGTFIDVYGIGVLLFGKSGIGKSEISLELVKRGHRLIADDLVEILKLGDSELIGRGINIVQHHMEIRGIGIIDLKSLFGIGVIREQQKVELVIFLEEWENDKDYERLGLEEKFENILGIKVPKIVLPVKPGRNLSIIIEVAAMMRRLKDQGHNTAKELNKTIINWMKREKKDV
ncbi:MAG: HPr(Ser) kinase/phosphatase [Candidatus Goldbacteria bacterium]|nr:HPr(Ser) kinase/phosphatase [Candidatus Goldiibacteriota bacterium]